MHDLDIIKIDECLVAKNVLTNVTKTNEHLNVVTFVHALFYMCVRPIGEHFVYTGKGFR